MPEQLQQPTAPPPLMQPPQGQGQQPQDQGKAGMLAGLTGEKLSPQQKQELESYVVMLMDLVHNKKTTNDVQDMLKSGEPAQTIPQTAMAVNGMAENMVKQKTKQPPSDVAKLGGSVYLVQDLIEVGNNAGIFSITDEQEVVQIYQDSLQMYIEAGLKDGSLDPIELQQQTEPLLSPEQTNQGVQMGMGAGVTMQPTTEMMNAQMGQNKQQGGVI